MAYGCMGKVLVVDLTEGKIVNLKIPSELYEKYSSGMGLAIALLYEWIPQNADPLGPENVLGFVSGFLTGTHAFFTGRWMVVGKSPLTGGWGDANAGGKFSYALKRSGYDGIFFKGVSQRPVYLRVEDGHAELKSADHLWGLDTLEAEKKINEEVGKKAQVALIGPAGEKRSLISGVLTDQARIAARSGLGAVMGSKNLKAVAVSGKKKIQVANPGRVKELNKKFKLWFDGGEWQNKLIDAKLLNKFGKFNRLSPIAVAQSGTLAKVVLNKYGTIATNVLSSEGGDSPVKNWKGAGCDDYPIRSHANNINPQRIINFQKRKYHCYSCPLGCGGILEVQDGPYELSETHKPEYETCCAFGTLLLNNDLHSIFKINDMLNKAGMDTISAGATIAWAIECYEQGLLSMEKMDGIDLAWGNAEGIIQMIERMIERKGFGDFLADGSKQAALRLGRGHEFAMHAGGQELPMHDSRFDPGFAVSYVLEPTPGRHTNHGYQWLELFALEKVFKNLSSLPHFSYLKSKYKSNKERLMHSLCGSYYMQFVNSVGACLFGVQMGGNLNLPAYMDAVTGLEHPPEHYLLIGERIQNLRQAFNIKHGINPIKDFALPGRAVGSPPLEKGPLKGVTLNTRKLYDEYLELSDWDKNTGAPTHRKLMELELHQAVTDMPKKEKNEN